MPPDNENCDHDEIKDRHPASKRDRDQPASRLLTCVQRAYICLLRGCHRPCAGGATTGVLPSSHPPSPRLPPALCRWSHNWRATILPSTITRAATGPVPVEPQLACYHPPIHHHPGCHRPCAGGVTTDVLPSSHLPSPRLPPALCRWSHNWRATILPSTITQAATGPVPVEPQLACSILPPPSPGCHRPCAGGATTDVLQGSASPTVASIRIQRTGAQPRQALGRKLRVDVASKCCRFDGEPNARPFSIGIHPTLDCTCGCAAAFVQGWHRWPFQGQEASSHPSSLRGCHRPCAGGATTDVLPSSHLPSPRLPPALCRWSHNWRATILPSTITQAATGPVPVEPQLTCYHPPIYHHPGCHRPCAGGATTGVLPSSHPPSPRLPPALCRWSHNWRATILPSTITQAATGPVPVEPQLACYKAHAPIADGRVDTYPTHRRSTATGTRP